MCHRKKPTIHPSLLGSRWLTIGSFPFFASFVTVFHKSANIQPSWPHAWLLTHIYSTSINLIIMFFLLNKPFLPFRNPTNRLVVHTVAVGMPVEVFTLLPSHNSFRPCCSKHGVASRCSADFVAFYVSWYVYRSMTFSWIVCCMLLLLLCGISKTGKNVPLWTSFKIT